MDVSKGFGFVAFDSFTSADNAIASMNGQYLGGKPISVSYAQKERGHAGKADSTHGSAAERLIASLRPKSLSVPNTGTGMPFPPPPPPPPPPPQYIR
jgi:splicing factor 3B subunit 4